MRESYSGWTTSSNNVDASAAIDVREGFIRGGQVIQENTKRKYRNDPTFNQLVDCLYHMIDTSKFTPEEMREALHFASYMYECDHVRPIFMYRETSNRKEGET